MTRVFINPLFAGKDNGDGGIRRVVEAQHQWLPVYGIEIVDHPEDADVIANHAGTWIDTNKPSVAHCHGLYWEGYEWQKWALHLNQDVIRTIKQADAVTGPSEWVSQAIRRGTWAPVQTFHHGINPEDWTPPGSPKMPSYVLWNKTRVDAICDPAPLNRLAKIAPHVDFVTTYGDAKSNVSVTGTVPYEQGKEYVRDASVYLCTSRETFGIGTLEAMACGVPVLGWRWGGQTEIVRHKIDGYLAEVDDYDDLLRGLEFCLEKRDELSIAARRRVLENFTWEKRIRPYAKLYRDLHERAVKSPKVSIVMPYYNLGKYVETAVNSVRKQTFADWELVIVDDASPEPLPESILDLAVTDSRVTVARNGENRYLAETLNNGIAISRGKYVLPLDADNSLPRLALEVLVGELDKDHSLDIAYGKIEFTQETSGDKFISDWPPEKASLDEQLRHKNQIPSSALYRRRVLDRAGGYRARCRTAEDADLWTRLLSIGCTGRRVTDLVTLNYLDRSDSMSHVESDWAWHKWYSYAQHQDLRLFAAGGKFIPTHEFPIVSVVIPVGPGHTRLVLDALDSLQNQSFRRWEAVVVNDSGPKLKNLPSWARVVETPELGCGASTARNLGIDAARGDLILFLDADDWLHQEALQHMVAKISELDHPGFIYSDWFVAGTKEDGEVKRMPDFDPDHILREGPYPVTCMYRRADLIKHKIRFDTSFNNKGWEDWDFQIQAIAREGLCGYRIAAPLFHYRLTSGTLRDKAYVARDEMKLEIDAKWHDYRIGKEPNMARCGACGGGVMRQVPAGTTAPSTQAAEGEGIGTVELEYTPYEAGRRTFLGPKTGLRYKFSDEQGQTIKRVRVEDVPDLLAKGCFREKVAPQLSETFEPLVAAGPPQQ